MELRAYQALKAVRLEDEYFYQSPFDLSGGQKRRVAIAGVLAMKPEMLILDEPAAGLDPQGRDEILELLTTLHREEGITVLLVSHSMEDVANYVERILVMNDGQIVLDDVPRRVFLHMKELEQIGLAAPEVTYVMHRAGKRRLLQMDAGKKGKKGSFCRWMQERKGRKAASADECGADRRLWH